MTCGIYIRVSEPKDFRRDPKRAEATQRQDTENQRLALERYAGGRGWTVVKVYAEHGSAGSGKERPVFQEFMQDARMKRFGVALFWALDRFSREGVFETLEHLRDLDRVGCAYCSYQEQYIDSACLFKEAIIGLIAALARQERERQSERVKAGLDRRRAQGKHVGRKPKPVDMRRLELAVRAKLSLNQIAEMFGVSRTTAKNYRKLLQTGQVGEIQRLNRLAQGEAAA